MANNNNNFTSKFLDTISEINNLGKQRGYRNGLDMASEALYYNIITLSEFNDYKMIHNLRNGGGHGFMSDLNITQKTYNFARFILKIFRQSKIHADGDYYRRHPDYKKTNNNHTSHHQKKHDDSHDSYEHYKKTIDTLYSFPEKKTLPNSDDDLFTTIRLRGNQIKVTVQKCEIKEKLFKKTVELILVVEDAYTQLIEYSIKTRDGDTFDGGIIDAASGQKQMIYCSFTCAKKLDDLIIDIDYNSFCYSLLKRMIIG